MGDEHPQRPAVRRQFLDVEHVEPVAREDPLDAEQRVVHEVLVVDRVELVALDQPGKMRDLDREDAGRRQEERQPGAEVVEIRDVGKDVVGHDQIGLPVLGDDAPGALGRQELRHGRDAALGRSGGDVDGGLDASARMPRATTCWSR